MKTSRTLLLLSLWTLLGGLALAADELDVRTQERLREAILDDARVSSYALVVDVASGVATVQGVVGSTAARDAVGEIARGVEGVRQVRNLLMVRPDVKLEDRDIELYVEEALSRDPIVQSSEITITCLKGVVELNGTADSKAERERAAKIASRILGVAKVRNELTLPVLDRPNEMTDEALAEAVERALAPELPNVRVLAERGVVTLAGSVPSPEARERAEKLAFAAGATLVRNETVVGPPKR